MNRLSSESSPYLLQHRDNPVNWYPWGAEAFERARAEDKPILLSVGYSSCHWCHVMAHESFEDEATAQVMNDHFVSVKVDREERPDVDAVYMEATQALTGRGGWPMTVFLTPAGKPFFAGTYFPKVARGGLPSFVELLEAVADAWRDQREDLETRAGTLTEAIASTSATMDGSADLADLAESSAGALRRWALEAWDPGWGGFGRAPKFPQAGVIEMALRWARGEPSDDQAFAMAATSLAGMAAGGIYDHLGGGFHRYSTDQRWLVPHFEKMLYDQAQLLTAYVTGWQSTGEAAWLQVARETVSYVLSGLALPGGGLASAEDADSEGEEGRFYLWRAKEIREALPDHLADALMDFYDITWKGNLSGLMEGGEGLNILHRPPGAPLLRPADVEEARALLLEHRSRRPHPGLDTLVLTEWNAMFLSALARAAGATGDPAWHRAATDLGDFLLARLRRSGDGRWMRSWQGGRALHLGYAADYAWIVDAFTRLGELTGRRAWTEAAIEAAEGLVDLFWDDKVGGFFTAGADAEQLVVRHKDLFDGSTPSANSAAALALWRLGALTGNERFHETAGRTLAHLGEAMATHPGASSFGIGALQLIARGAIEVVVAGERPDLVEVVQRTWVPEGVLAWGEPYPTPLWEGRTPLAAEPQKEGTGLAYVCEGFTCEMPTGDPLLLAAQLDRLRRPPR